MGFYLLVFGHKKYKYSEEHTRIELFKKIIDFVSVVSIISDSLQTNDNVHTTLYSGTTVSLILKKRFQNPVKPEGSKKKRITLPEEGNEKHREFKTNEIACRRAKRHILGYINSSLRMGCRRVRGSTNFKN